MLNKKIIFAAIAFTAVAAIWTYAKTNPSNEKNDSPLIADASNSKMVALGTDLYSQHCAECHGANLEGQPDWREKNPDSTLPAPPHDASGHTWHHTDAMNFKYTKFGGQNFNSDKFKSAMPAFKDTLKDMEILSVLSYIKSKWPKDVQKKHKRINKRTAK